MAIPTGLIGLLPTYESIGIIAPILLVVMRLVQGLCAGGQYSGAVILSYEMAQPQRRALQCSVNHVTSMAGYCLAILVSLGCFHLTHSWLSDNCWRIPFLLSPCIMIIYYVLVQWWKVMLSGEDPVSIDKSRCVPKFRKLFFEYQWNFVLASFVGCLRRCALFYIVCLYDELYDAQCTFY